MRVPFFSRSQEAWINKSVSVCWGVEQSEARLRPAVVAPRRSRVRRTVGRSTLQPPPKSKNRSNAPRRLSGRRPSRPFCSATDLQASGSAHWKCRADVKRGERRFRPLRTAAIQPLIVDGDLLPQCSGILARSSAGNFPSVDVSTALSLPLINVSSVFYTTLIRVFFVSTENGFSGSRRPTPDNLLCREAVCQPSTLSHILLGKNMHLCQSFLFGSRSLPNEKALKGFLEHVSWRWTPIDVWSASFDELIKHFSVSEDNNWNSDNTKWFCFFRGGGWRYIWICFYLLTFSRSRCLQLFSRSTEQWPSLWECEYWVESGHAALKTWCWDLRQTVTLRLKCWRAQNTESWMDTVCSWFCPFLSSGLGCLLHSRTVFGVSSQRREKNHFISRTVVKKSN